jgi:2-hydroxychromene-2-carboxylate isomerase
MTSPLRDPMTSPVRVAVDFGCAESWLAVEPTRALELRLGMPFEWLPFPSVTRSWPKVVLADKSRGMQHFRMRSEYLANDLRRYAASRGLDLGDVHRSVDIAASLGLEWLSRKAPAATGEYVMRVFDRIWRDNDEADLDFIDALLDTRAPGFRDFAAEDGRRELEASRERLSAEGVWTVPAYLAGGQLFIGRQHLPMVEKLARAK